MGSQHCSHCGAKTVPAKTQEQKAGSCPRCKIKLNLLQINDISLLECQKCSGYWSNSETFENICAEKEQQANVLFFMQNKQFPKNNVPVNYVPCPDCKQLMNRSNFARTSGIILDICKQHGVWFDAEELPKLIDFIRQGGLDRARQREKMKLEEQRRELDQMQHRIEMESRRFGNTTPVWNESYSLSVRGFVKLLFD